MELLTLGIFCALLLGCIVLDISILYALAAGLGLFLLYGRKKGFSWRELLKMAFDGVKTVKNILITFVLIGMLTALWRDAGTVPTIVCYASRLIRPSIFVLMTFLLNCLVSVLTGTAFGTAATMGVICATIAGTMGISPVLTGGAVLAGAYFGDRCSPVSTSALLVSELTKTSIFQNIRGMMRTAWLPFLVSCGIYTVAGMLSNGAGEVPDLHAIFGREFAIGWVMLLPAVVILVLSVCQVNVKIAMAASILVSIPISLFVQQTPPGELLQLLFTGYTTSDSEIAAMLSGGGILSMVRVASIVCLSSSYSGIFRKTGLLDRVQQSIDALARRTNAYTASLVTSMIAGMIACNQTLTIMLTNQLCRETEPDEKRFAIVLEDSAVVIAPLIPWSIAGGVPLASIGAPTAGILFACFLYLLPLWRLTQSAISGRKTRA